MPRRGEREENGAIPGGESRRTTAPLPERTAACEAVKLLPGEFFATADGTPITTLLGSCVAVCLYDPAGCIGGMNHFMLPELVQGEDPSHCYGHCNRTNCARYGSCAMRLLLLRLEQLGARCLRLEAKLFGAGRVMAGMSDIGEKNASFALAYLSGKGIPVVASDLGGGWPRKVVFYPAGGQALVKRMRQLPPEEWGCRRGDSSPLPGTAGGPTAPHTTGGVPANGVGRKDKA